LTFPTGKYLDGNTLADALTSGIHRVIADQELLNRINVFPVADSDTGTNLSLSLSSALGILAQSGDKHLGTLLAAVADALLDGARGNSGAILAQFFQGLSDSAEDLTRFTAYTFNKAVALGNEYAHDALSQPREGTILSVIAAFADSIAHQAGTQEDAGFGSLMQKAREAVDEALANTPNQLEVLRKAGVVDAGAKGFADLVSGMTAYLQDGTVTPAPDTAFAHEIEPVVDFSAADNASQYRFCTECMVSGTDINRRKLREALAQLGDSLVLAGTKRKAKIHIHVDDPDKVFDVARRFGTLSAEKADDMHRQQHATHEGKRKFAVITDSAADIPDADMERLDIHLVPCRIQFGDHGYLDKVSITIDEFYEELENNAHHPTTSQPAPGDFRRQFQFLASHFDDIVSINLTSVASGTFQAAQLAAERTGGPGRIHVVDSRNASLGQGQLAVFAAECAAAGLDVDATLEAVRSQVPSTTSYAMLKDLRYAVRGGRLPGWVRSVAELLHLTPIIYTPRKGGISLSGFLLLARQFRARVPNLGKLTICGLGPALGVHGGPGTLLAAVRPYVLPEDIAGRPD
jgi:DegV family protein with EDD domain